VSAISRVFLVASIAVLAGTPAFFVAAQQQVGVASTTAGEPRGTPPAENERVLKVGTDIKANERVRTAANDRAHLVFDDGSALTVGVGSDLVIDRFVYDPAKQSGELTIDATRGAFRFVGGAISKKKEVVVHTPSAEVGIRGGIFTWTVEANGGLTLTFLYGEYLKVSNPMGTQFATRYGSQIYVPGLNLPPTPPVILSQGALQAYLKLFEKSQLNGNILGPGDTATLQALVAGLNPQKLSYADSDPTLFTWLTFLHAVASQGVATNNANGQTGQPPSTGAAAPAMTPAPLRFNGQGGTHSGP
jgi:FecR protein